MDDPSLHPNPLVRLSQTSWPLFRAFRVNVRASWSIAVMPLFFAWEFGKWLPMREALPWALAWTAALYFAVWTHEMGHVSMGRRCGIDTDRITLRALGGLAHLHAPAQTPSDEIKISLAGPVVHLAWFALVWPAKRLLAADHGDATWFFMLERFADLQLTLLVFNLLPVYPLDGGAALRGLLALRMDPGRATLVAAQVGFVGNVAIGLVGIASWTGLWDPFGFGKFGVFAAWMGIEGFMACLHLRRQAQYGDVYGGHDPFARTLLASQAAVREMESTERAERDERRAAQERRRQLQETADRLLDRINELGGVDKLSASERKELERASRALAEGGD